MRGKSIPKTEHKPSTTSFKHEEGKGVVNTKN